MRPACIETHCHFLDGKWDRALSTKNEGGLSQPVTATAAASWVMLLARQIREMRAPAPNKGAPPTRQTARQEAPSEVERPQPTLSA